MPSPATHDRTEGSERLAACRDFASPCSLCNIREKLSWLLLLPVTPNLGSIVSRWQDATRYPKIPVGARLSRRRNQTWKSHHTAIINSIRFATCYIAGCTVNDRL